MSKGQSNRLRKLEATLGTNVREEITIRQLKASADVWRRNDGRVGTFAEMTAGAPADSLVVLYLGDPPTLPDGLGAVVCLPDNSREDARDG